MVSGLETLKAAPITARKDKRRSLRTWLWPESGAVNPIPALDGLRACAILLVLVFHAWYKVPGYLAPGQPEESNPLNIGHTGVQLFFVLSGFLLFLPYARWLLGCGARPSVLLFYKRRALRVGPAYWASLLFILLTGTLSAARLKDVALHVVFLSNLSSATIYSLNGVYYTMAVEVQFYVALPLLGFLAVRLARKLGAWPAMFVLLAGLIALSTLDKSLSSQPSLLAVPVVGTFVLNISALPYWLATFGFGMTASVLYIYLTQIRPGLPHLPRWGSLVFVAGVALFLALDLVPAVGLLPLPLSGIDYSLVLLGILFGVPMIRAPFASRPLRFIGLISYSFYLWHLGVLKVVGPHLARFPLTEQVALRLVALLTLGTLVAYLSYQFTERPFMRARKKAHEATEQSPAFWWQEGQRLFRAQRYEDALTAYNRLLKMTPHSARAWHNAGSVLAQLHRYEFALEAYDRALALEPDYTLAWQHRVAILRELGQQNGVPRLESVAPFPQAFSRYDQ